MLILTAVASRNAKNVVNIGTEMLESYRQKKPLPIIVEIHRTDKEYIRRIKRIISHMTEFRSIERKNIQEVEEEYKGTLIYALIL